MLAHTCTRAHILPQCIRNEHTHTQLAMGQRVQCCEGNTCVLNVCARARVQPSPLSLLLASCSPTVHNTTAVCLCCCRTHTQRHTTPTAACAFSPLHTNTLPHPPQHRYNYEYAYGDMYGDDDGYGGYDDGYGGGCLSVFCGSPQGSLSPLSACPDASTHAQLCFCSCGGLWLAVAL